MIQSDLREIHHIGPDTSELLCPPSTRPAMAPHGMSLAGISDIGPNYRMHRPRPPHGHLLVCHAGAGRVWIDHQWHTCSEGHAYLSPPLAPSAFESLPDQRWHIAWIFFEGPPHSSPGQLSLPHSTLLPANPRPLLSAIEGLYREGISHADPQLLTRWADLIHAYALRILSPKTTEPTDPLWKLWAAVDARPAHPWTLHALAQLANLNIESLRKLSLLHTGHSPMRHVTHLRMRRADSLLQSTPAKLSTIAQLVGYQNPFAFSTTFRKIHGIPPSERRRTSFKSR